MNNVKQISFYHTENNVPYGNMIISHSYLVFHTWARQHTELIQPGDCFNSTHRLPQREALQSKYVQANGGQFPTEKPQNVTTILMKPGPFDRARRTTWHTFPCYGAR